MVKKINQFITFVLGTKLMMWAVPDSKRFIKGIAITAVVVFLVIYFYENIFKKRIVLRLSNQR